MSGGYFDRNTYAMREITNTIEHDIAKALQQKPEKVHMDYWAIYGKDSFCSYHDYRTFMDFGCYEDAESFLLRDKTIVKGGQQFADQLFFVDGIIFHSIRALCPIPLKVRAYRCCIQSIIVVMTAIPLALMCWNWKRILLNQ